MQVPGLSSTIQGQGPSVMLNMFFVRALLILCVILVCTLMVSDIGPAVFLLAFAGWGLMQWAAVYRASCYWTLGHPSIRRIATGIRP